MVDPEKRRAATDFTFSAPKSVSIAALVQQDERVLEAHRQAVAKALLVLEERYAQTRISTENELAIALKQQGYLIEPKAHGQFEPARYSPELLKAFSTRRQQILKLIEE
ncbi:relaxase domain-containing protein [Nodosilinea sp. LEGE 07088]|uniref:relaxase domain-containing protein n=1 Tax=Nodosilinea sp. LEGE 07088 TaxID=2777968 RepID=UPI00187E3DCB|nr:relaxase domain-containing protein [Nodosilinea sp. LEGE 07088]MBE9140785.1 relaxase domain-containing protein [Nodosilinea sp. LEGE 07088]